MILNNIKYLMINFKDDFKLIDVCYYENSRILSLKFLTKDQDEEKQKKLESEIEENLNLSLEYNFKYLKPDESVECFYNMLKDYFEIKYNYKNLKLNDVEIHNLNEINIDLKLDDDIYKQCKFNGVNDLNFDLTTFKKVNINLYPQHLKILEEEKDDNILSTREKILKNFNNNYDTVQRTFKINGLDIIVGKNFKGFVSCLNQIENECEFIQVAGMIKYFTQRSFQKKEVVNGKEELVEKPYYTFEIVDGFGKINASYFPTKAYLESEKKLEDGQIVTLCGAIQKYRENLSLKVKEIAYCCIPDGQIIQNEIVSPKTILNTINEEKIEFKSEPDNYTYVQPLPYSELNQMDMFALVNSGEENVTKSLKGKDYVVFDLETTGFDFINGEILEIGAVKIRDGKIIETFETLCKPNIHIPSDATAVNGITDEMVKDAPKFSQIVGDFYKFTRNSTLVAHNAEFDTTFLSYHALKNRYNYDNDVMDTLAMSRRLIKGLKNYKLITVATYFNIKLEHAHRALFDTIATAKSFIELCKLEDK